MSDILVYALHYDGAFNKNSLGAVSEGARLAAELGTECHAIVVGDKAGLITQTVPWDRFRVGDVGQLPLGEDGQLKFPALRQEGQSVFRWAVYEMAKVAQEALDAAGVPASDLDAFIPHQANMRIIDSMIKALKLPEHVAVARDIETTGNTSAASIPLAMERLLATGEAKSGDTALIIGFGAGLVYAASVVTLP